ncbi:copper amine oxidase domain protein, partial [Reticulomyxa filosa]
LSKKKKKKKKSTHPKKKTNKHYVYTCMYMYTYIKRTLGDIEKLVRRRKSQREAAQTEVQQKQEILTKWLEIGDHDVLQLKAYIAKLEKRLSDETDRVRVSEKSRRDSIAYLSTQMMTSLVEAETEHEKKLQDMSSSISRLEEEKKSLNSQLHTEERKRKNSNAEVSATMFQKVLKVEQEKEDQKQVYEAKIKDLEQQLDEIRTGAPRRASEVHSVMFKSLLEAEEDFNHAKEEWTNKENELKNEIKALSEELTKSKQQIHKSDKQRKESISQLQDDMWKHLVEVDEDNKKERKQLQAEVKGYRDEVMVLRKRVSHLENSKLALIEECNRQMNLLRLGIRAMNGTQ